MLEMASIPVASRLTFVNERKFSRSDTISYPIVLKPLGGNHGKELLLILPVGRCSGWFSLHKHMANDVVENS
jgi:glutathione synthase/RimK-type ligase-like ATP-grasp enzyme